MVADPDFDLSDEVSPPSTLASQRSGDLRDAHFAPLPGTLAEARALESILQDPNVLTGAAASETAVKKLASPRILHIATHGFFLPDVARAPVEAQQATRGVELPGLPTARYESPLLRAGLALAGANRLQGGGGEDGILTGLEVSSLDLEGTQLVVLSACETGLGEVRLGDGVYGLRRALVLAGAESQLMSLWKVDDEASRELIEATYHRLLAGEGRAAALRNAQLELRRRRPHPYYWAAFAALGEWRPLH